MSTKLEVLEKRHQEKLSTIKKRKDALLGLVSILELEEEKAVILYNQERKILEEKQQKEVIDVRIEKEFLEFLGEDRNISEMVKEWGRSMDAIQFVTCGKMDPPKELIKTRVYVDPTAKKILDNLANFSLMTMPDIIREAIKQKEKQNEEVTE